MLKQLTFFPRKSIRLYCVVLKTISYIIETKTKLFSKMRLKTRFTELKKRIKPIKE